ncbi:hypothetical protein BC828DRAFT_387516 [Blastocladiella britannica]|nr:hypothetical protein BC828DRAFT_387516 [Blastocladiella britannica]
MQSLPPITAKELAIAETLVFLILSAATSLLCILSTILTYHRKPGLNGPAVWDLPPGRTVSDTLARIAGGAAANEDPSMNRWAMVDPVAMATRDGAGGGVGETITRTSSDIKPASPTSPRGLISPAMAPLLGGDHHQNRPTGLFRAHFQSLSLRRWFHLLLIIESVIAFTADIVALLLDYVSADTNDTDDNACQPHELAYMILYHVSLVMHIVLSMVRAGVFQRLFVQPCAFPLSWNNNDDTVPAAAEAVTKDGAALVPTIQVVQSGNSFGRLPAGPTAAAAAAPIYSPPSGASGPSVTTSPPRSKWPRLWVVPKRSLPPVEIPLNSTLFCQQPKVVDNAPLVRRLMGFVSDPPLFVLHRFGYVCEVLRRAFMISAPVLWIALESKAIAVGCATNMTVEQHDWFWGRVYGVWITQYSVLQIITSLLVLASLSIIVRQMRYPNLKRALYVDSHLAAANSYTRWSLVLLVVIALITRTLPLHLGTSLHMFLSRVYLAWQLLYFGALARILHLLPHIQFNPQQPNFDDAVGDTAGEQVAAASLNHRRPKTTTAAAVVSSAVALPETDMTSAASRSGIVLPNPGSVVVLPATPQTTRALTSMQRTAAASAPSASAAGTEPVAYRQTTPAHRESRSSIASSSNSRVGAIITAYGSAAADPGAGGVHRSPSAQTTDHSKSTSTPTMRSGGPLIHRGPSLQTAVSRSNPSVDVFEDMHFSIIVARPWCWRSLVRE